MYANFLNHFLRKLFKWERNGNFKQRELLMWFELTPDGYPPITSHTILTWLFGN